MLRDEDLDEGVLDCAEAAVGGVGMASGGTGFIFSPCCLLERFGLDFFLLKGGRASLLSIFSFTSFSKPEAKGDTPETEFAVSGRQSSSLKFGICWACVILRNTGCPKYARYSYVQNIGHSVSCLRLCSSY